MILAAEQSSRIPDNLVSAGIVLVVTLILGLGTVQRLLRSVRASTEIVAGQIRTRLEAASPAVRVAGDNVSTSGDISGPGAGPVAQGASDGIGAALAREVLEELRRLRVERRQGDDRTYKVLAEHAAQSLSQAQISFPEGLFAGNRRLGTMGSGADTRRLPPSPSSPYVEHPDQERFVSSVTDSLGQEVVRQIVDRCAATVPPTIHQHVPGEGGPAGFYARLGFVPTRDRDLAGEVILRRVVHE